MVEQDQDPRYFRLIPVRKKPRKPGCLLAFILSLTLLGGLFWIGWQRGWFPSRRVIAGHIASLSQASSYTGETNDDRTHPFAPDISATPSPTSSPSLTPAPATATLTPAPTRIAYYGTVIYAARKDGYSHLWSYSPGDAYSTILTTGSWDDRDPAISPDGKIVAFASNRDGYWDLYLLDLNSLDVRRLTDTPLYEGRPAWSLDSKWICYEADDNGDLDLWISETEGSQLFQLTDYSGADLAPVWDPAKRRIAFVSDRDGNSDIFIANLEEPEDRFSNLTNTSLISEKDPAFSPDGSLLAYSENKDGIDRLMIRSMELSDAPAVQVGHGVRPAWSPDGQILTAILRMPNESQIVSYSISGAIVVPIGLSLENGSHGITWSSIGLAVDTLTRLSEMPTDEPLYYAQIDQQAEGIDRTNIVAIDKLEAPYAMLSDAADEAFNALRQRVIEEVGWDFLGQLENAFVGMNDPLPPGYAYNDWLYTGRAFAFNQAIVLARWAEVVREDHGEETYWRVFIKVKSQDGSRGEPLREYPWDFGKRFYGDVEGYDQGGGLRDQIPKGYYIDFTEIAADYGFLRVPALPNWRYYYQGAHFNEYALIDDLDWTEAMLEIYPAEAIRTPTPFRTPTATPTRTPWPTATPWWWRQPTATASPLGT